MKKVFTLGLTLVFAMALISSMALAGADCTKGKADASACAKSCGVTTAKACGTADTKTTAEADRAKTEGTLVNADGQCTYTGKCSEVTLAISGMTCTGCENTIKTALMAKDGVIKVCAIDYKTGMATVCFDPAKVEGGSLAQLVSTTGYESKVTTAVASGCAAKGGTNACSGHSLKVEDSGSKKEDH